MTTKIEPTSISTRIPTEEHQKYIAKAMELIKRKYRLKITFINRSGVSEIFPTIRYVFVYLGGNGYFNTESSYDPVFTLLHEVGHWAQIRRIRANKRMAYYYDNKLKCESYASRWALRAAKLIGYKGDPTYLKLCYDTYAYTVEHFKQPESIRLINAVNRFAKRG